MGNWERNLLIFGTAGFLAVAGVFLSRNLAFGIVWSFLVLAVAMFLGLGRFGPDHATLEEWILRRWRYARSVKRYTYIQPQAFEAAPVPAPQPKPRPEPRPKPSPPQILPVTIATDDAGALQAAVGAMLLAAGAIFIVWLESGGDAVLANSFQTLFSWR